MQYLFLCACWLYLCLLPMHGQTIMGGIITSGATNAPTRAGFGMQGALGQPMIGEAGIAPQIRTGIMSIGDRSQRNYESTLVTIDTVLRQIGDTFDLPVRYAAPCGFFADNVLGRSWELSVSMNRTVIEPLEYDAIVDDGERYTITVTGRADSQMGVVTNLRMMTRLGNDSVTDVRVESFRWIDIPRQYVRSVAGSVQLRGLCNTYGSTRLLKDTNSLQLLVAPNPVSTNTVSIRAVANHSQMGTLTVTDMHGTLVFTQHHVTAAPHAPLSTIDLSHLAGGTYVVSFVTPSAVVRTPLVKLP